MQTDMVNLVNQGLVGQEDDFNDLDSLISEADTLYNQMIQDDPLLTDSAEVVEKPVVEEPAKIVEEPVKPVEEEKKDPVAQDPLPKVEELEEEYDIESFKKSQEYLTLSPKGKSLVDKMLEDNQKLFNIASSYSDAYNSELKKTEELIADSQQLSLTKKQLEDMTLTASEATNKARLLEQQKAPDDLIDFVQTFNQFKSSNSLIYKQELAKKLDSLSETIFNKRTNLSMTVSIDDALSEGGSSGTDISSEKAQEEANTILSKYF